MTIKWVALWRMLWCTSNVQWDKDGVSGQRVGALPIRLTLRFMLCKRKTLLSYFCEFPEKEGKKKKWTLEMDHSTHKKKSGS